MPAPETLGIARLESAQPSRTAQRLRIPGSRRFLCLLLILPALGHGIGLHGAETAAAASSDLAWAENLEAELGATLERALPAFAFVAGGSGVCVSADGWVLTNHHVVARRDTWTVRVLGRPALYAGRVVGRDRMGDLALLKLDDARDLPWLRLADLGQARAGQPVIALGDPFKLGDLDGAPSVSFGTLCALRRYQGDPNNPFLATFYPDALQTDAAVNPGNSGGPLLNLRGELLGLTGQIMARFSGRTNSGVAYAVPADRIARFLPLLKAAAGGEVFHGTLPEGLRLELEPAPEAPEGVRILEVEDDSSAEKAGFRKGDRILAADGQHVRTAYQLLGRVQSLPEGEKVAIELLRGEKRKGLELRLTRLAPAAAPGEAPALGARLGLPEPGRAGLPILSVKAGGAAGRAGLRPGDRLQWLGARHAVRDWPRLQRDLSERKLERKLPVRFSRESDDVLLEAVLELK
ncbi:MAG: trypsin-like peptidase domain-containing protein [Planctomycetota bacterium]|nr:trypsin-like peptidase domain-containing protein [Planctomycetota bacterium]